MNILGIETSCDETAAAVVQDGTKILSNVVASSSDMHEKTGGIIPESAARQQVKSMLPVINQALSEAFKKRPITHNLSPITNSIDAIAVTVGPGLIGSLLVGVETAKALSYLWKKPIIPVNHLVAHIYANFIREFPNSKFQFPIKLPSFPLLALVVSGGHTDLVLMKNYGKIKWIGGTRDDAAGEAFDKSARLLGLPYPGGPAISKEADKYFSRQTSAIGYRLNMFPRPMIDNDSFDWSFSGLKTAVLTKTKELKNQRTKELSKTEVSKLAAEVQEAIVDVLVTKTLKAAERYNPKSLLLAGGVAANNRLRQKFKLEIENSKLKIDFFVPPPSLCTDNAAYIAAFANFNYRPVHWKKIAANPQLTITGEK